MRVNFGELKIGDTAKEHVLRALGKNWVSEGDNVREFEQKFASKFGYKHAIATSSGTDADLVSCASLYDFGGTIDRELGNYLALCPTLIPLTTGGHYKNPPPDRQNLS
ncbi:unnamed protein product, partial [marine sediment metagenome]